MNPSRNEKSWGPVEDGRAKNWGSRKKIYREIEKDMLKNFWVEGKSNNT